MVIHAYNSHADGTQLIAGIGNRVLVYDATDGDLLHALKGHKVKHRNNRKQNALFNGFVNSFCPLERRMPSTVWPIPIMESDSPQEGQIIL